MTEPHAPLPPGSELERLLAEVHIRLRQERHAEASALLEKAKTQAPPDHLVVLELEGDLLFAQGRYKQAEQIYHRAFQANPKNARLEEKYATALLKVNEPALLAHTSMIPDDDPVWSLRVSRPIWASTLLSILLPGLGQWFNGDLLKGAVLMLVYTCGLLSHVYPLIKQMNEAFHKSASVTAPHSLVEAIGSFLHGPRLIGTLLLTAIMIYAAIDAALVAKETKQ